MKLLKIACFLILACITPLLKAVPADSLEVSLLTCEPGREIYGLYGHTAIRYTDYKTGDDWVFNYGVFDFRKPNFVWRFTKGECDYQLGAVPFYYFEKEYSEEGIDVYQQVLNMTTEEKRRLWDLLVENMKPENKVYRYNFLYYNCTTRARDRIEEAISGKVCYPKSDSLHTYREIIHQYTKGHEWAELGNDLCLGATADTLITERDEMFAPWYMKRYAAGAVIKDNEGNIRPFVTDEYQIVSGNEIEIQESNYPSPSVCVWLIVAFVAVWGLIEYKSGKIYWAIDVILYLLVGIMGLILTFLLFFSIHPTVNSNWQVLVFNPLPLIALPWILYCNIRGRKTAFHKYYFLYLTLFIIFSWAIPQDFTVVVVPLALALLLRTCSYMLYYKKTNRN